MITGHRARQELLCTSSEDGAVKVWHLGRAQCLQSLALDGGPLDGGSILDLVALPISGHLLLACSPPSRQVAEPEGGLQRFTRNTFVFLAAGAGGEKVSLFRRSPYPALFVHI